MATDVFQIGDRVARWDGRPGTITAPDMTLAGDPLLWVHIDGQQAAHLYQPHILVRAGQALNIDRDARAHALGMLFDLSEAP